MKNHNLKPDAVLKDYWRNNDRFADLFNQVFFDGNDLLNPDNLTDKDTEDSAVIMEQGKMTSISRARDLIKLYENGINLVLIGIENQMKVHYGMPVRTMLYEALDYTKQCKELEQRHRKNKDLQGCDEFLSGISPNDKINASVTLVIYYGQKAWDGPISLRDMMNIPAPFQSLFNNHNIHLLSVQNAPNYNFKNKDNRDFFTLIDEIYRNSGKLDINHFKTKYPDLDVYWETLAALGAATGTMELVTYALENEGGNVRMCTALENLKKEGIQEGIQKGEIIGMIKAYREMNCAEELIFEKIQKQYQLSEEEIKEYL